MNYHRCPQDGATTPLKPSWTQRRSQSALWTAHAHYSASVCDSGVMVAVIMLSFILSRTLCQTVAEATCKSHPTLVTTLRTFTTSGSRCGEDSDGGKIILINVCVKVKSKVQNIGGTLKYFSQQISPPSSVDNIFQHACIEKKKEHLLNKYFSKMTSRLWKLRTDWRLACRKRL